jgi:hypothetical protein
MPEMLPVVAAKEKVEEAARKSRIAGQQEGR